MPVFTYTFKGADELSEFLSVNLPRVPPQLGPDALAAGAQIIADSARSKVPVISGKLRDSIVIVPQIEGPSDGTFKVYVAVKEPYAGDVEFGTRHNRAEPFLRPAVDEASEGAVLKTGQTLWDELQQRANQL